MDVFNFPNVADVFPAKSFPAFLSITVSAILGILLLSLKRWMRQPSLKVPPGKLGFPVIGETPEFLRLFREGKPQVFFDQRVKKFGDVFKTSLIGHPTIVLMGPAGNRFVLANEDKLVRMSWPKSFMRLLGEESIGTKRGEDHHRLRAALATFLGPQAIRNYLSETSFEIQRHITERWKGKSEVKMLPLVKEMVFSVAASMFFGITEDSERERLRHLFETTIAGSFSVPINFPGTRFRKAIEAHDISDKILFSLIESRRINGTATSHKDLLSLLISFRDDKGNPLTDNEIVDNFNGVLHASYETIVSALISLFKFSAANPDCYEEIVREQMAIITNQNDGEEISWKDLKDMKYTWQALQEALRMRSPSFGTFREAITDLDYKGYTIPKGWKILWTVYSTHTKEEYFSEPEKFKPSRFQEESVNKLAPYTFLPFSAGQRVCPGWEFAKTEILLFVHHFVKSFSGFTDLNPGEQITLDPIFPLPLDGFPIKLFARS